MNTPIHRALRLSPAPPPRNRAVEAAIVLPFLILLLLGTLEVGRLLNVQQILTQAASTGGERASAGDQTNAQVQQSVLNYLSSAGIPTTNVVVTVRDLTHPGIDATEAVQLDNLEITVTIPAADVAWTGTAFIVGQNNIIGGRAQWVSACGQVYPTNISVPPGF